MQASLALRQTWPSSGEEQLDKEGGEEVAVAPKLEAITQGPSQFWCRMVIGGPLPPRRVVQVAGWALHPSVVWRALTVPMVLEVG